jgi:hypothetical protein
MSDISLKIKKVSIENTIPETKQAKLSPFFDLKSSMSIIFLLAQ